MDVVLVVDNLSGSAMAIASVEVDPDLGELELKVRYEMAEEKIKDLINTIETDSAPFDIELREREEPADDPEFSSTMEQEGFEENVSKIRDLITAGDVFQVVISQRLSMPMAGTSFDLYRVLRKLNPSPYLYLLEIEDFSLVGSSPEVLVRLRDQKITVRPIAGTRPRGKSSQEDIDLELDLRTDEKELAEHRMLVDLGRNDLGRVADYGSIEVTDLMVVERYSHVMHLVSQADGTLRQGLSAMDVFRACFPAGTVTGAPKVRAMEIIDELEPCGRGPYAGAVGYFGWGGLSMDLAITIRTVLVSEGKAFVQVGAGVVADSDPTREFEETLNKARALLKAVAMLENGRR
jgi:anthranilate synthase component 1